MKINALVPWFGGKRFMAKAVIAELGPHSVYHEPFCGSMAVLLMKPAVAHETVNDLHGDLTNLALCIQDYDLAEDLYDRLGRVLFSDGMLETARRNLESVPWTLKPDPDRAFWYFIASWMMRNGTQGTALQTWQLCVRWTSGGGSPTVRFRSAVESLPAWHVRLRNVVILRRDAFAILPRIVDAVGTAVYCDPPYLLESRNSHTAKGQYLHDFESEANPLMGGEDDHALLARELRRFQFARVVVSYYDCPRARALYRGWRVVDCMAKKNLTRANVAACEVPDAPEILLVNHPGSGSPLEEEVGEM